LLGGDLPNEPVDGVSITPSQPGQEPDEMVGEPDNPGVDAGVTEAVKSMKKIKWGRKN